MGKYNGNVNSTDAIYQGLPATLPGQMRSAPAYFNGSIYVADVGRNAEAIRVDGCKAGGDAGHGFHP